jgi:hypothetical protein
MQYIHFHILRIFFVILSWQGVYTNMVSRTPTNAVKLYRSNNHITMLIYDAQLFLNNHKPIQRTDQVNCAETTFIFYCAPSLHNRYLWMESLTKVLNLNYLLLFSQTIFDFS